MNKNVVYTVIIGDYDNLKTPSPRTAGWDYICFTDDLSLKSDVWKILQIPKEYLDIVKNQDPKRAASLLKIEYYKIIDPSYNIVIYVDGSIKIKTDLNKFMKKNELGKHDLIITKCPARKCMYDEANAIARYGFDDRKLIISQMTRYRQLNYPENNGLWSSRLMIRNNKSLRLKYACKTWAQEYRNGSRRDMLSLNYSFWKSSKLGHDAYVKTLDHNSIIDGHRPNEKGEPFIEQGNPFEISRHLNPAGRQQKKWQSQNVQAHEMISVIIPTLWWVKEFWAELQKLSACEYIGEIILIDNTKRRASLAPWVKKMRHILEGKNTYVTAAWNKGVRLAKYEKLLILNDDTYFDWDLISQIHMKVTPLNGMLGMRGKPGSRLTKKPSPVRFTPVSKCFEGFACAFFIHKQNWIPIPEEMKIHGNDWWEFRIQEFHGRQNFMIEGLELRGQMNGTVQELWRRPKLAKIMRADKKWRQDREFPGQWVLEEWDIKNR